MSEAFVLVSTEVGAETDALEEIMKLEQVQEASVVYGVYDIVTRIRAKSSEDLKEVITKKIRVTTGVKNTLTMIVSERQTR